MNHKLYLYITDVKDITSARSMLYYYILFVRLAYIEFLDMVYSGN